MATKDFKTRSIFMERQNSFPKNIWNIGIDIGYSAVKVMSPNAVCCVSALQWGFGATRSDLRMARGFGSRPAFPRNT